MSSIDTGQTPLDTVHLKVALLPEGTPVTVVVGDEGVVIVAEPLTTDQEPVPIAGLIAVMVKSGSLQFVWLIPAVAVDGGASF